MIFMNNGCNLKYVKRDRWKCFRVENRELVASTMTSDEFSDHSNLFSTFLKEPNYTFFAKMRYRKRRLRPRFVYKYFNDIISFAVINQKTLSSR